MAPRKVLFLCTGNSCRSQMAEGWLRHYAGDRAQVFSAGTKPAGLNPMAVAVMRERGIDISGHHSKHVNDLVKEDFLFVITVCDSAREPARSSPERSINCTGVLKTRPEPPDQKKRNYRYFER